MWNLHQITSEIYVQTYIHLHTYVCMYIRILISSCMKSSVQVKKLLMQFYSFYPNWCTTRWMEFTSNIPKKQQKIELLIIRSKQFKVQFITIGHNKAQLYRTVVFMLVRSYAPTSTFLSRWVFSWVIIHCAEKEWHQHHHKRSAKYNTTYYVYDDDRGSIELSSQTLCSRADQWTLDVKTGARPKFCLRLLFRCSCCYRSSPSLMSEHCGVVVFFGNFFCVSKNSVTFSKVRVRTARLSTRRTDRTTTKQQW